LFEVTAHVEVGVLPSGSPPTSCRYNYTTGREAPEISSSEIFMAGGFHQPELWRQLVS